MKMKKKLSMGSLGALALTLTSIATISAQPAQAETLQNLNFRTGPSTSYPIISTLKKGTTVNVVEKSGIWTLVKHNNTVGYVSSNYLKNITATNKPPQNDNDTNSSLKLMECTTASLNVRKGPSTSDSIIGKVYKTDRVYVAYTTSNGWSRIKYGSGYGYVSSHYLKDIKENSNGNNNSGNNNNNNSSGSNNVNATMQCNVTSLNIRKGPTPSDSIVGSLKYKDKVNVVANLSNGWSKISFNGGYAYVSTQYLSKSETNTPSNSSFMKCNTDVLNVRSGPSSSEKIIGKLRKGEKVEVLYNLNSGWVRIKFNNSYGYVAGSYLI
ncbi:SH3 domain-containing protein [Romboutsia lituseburensis]|uniref:SH3 domain-containing protein n=1 Tax=Romboutsia lituseburensis TaxID=1537 RepID=UPI00215A49BC|nr:SH3 domain-containing protein [Romboutsia lituseburensis]MCR8746873.1 SH3 domain-containing protein [Romboutsia lituseburensis]